MKLKLNCLITGVGGQGTVLLSRLIGDAALAQGLNVRGSETIGMSQRGGSVVSHIRMSDGLIHSPLIPPAAADIIIALEPAEAARTLPFLSPGGKILAFSRPLQPAGASRAGPYDAAALIAGIREEAGPRFTLVDAEKLTALCSSKTVNIALLGAALGLDIFPFGREDIITVLKKRLPEKFWDMNIKVLSVFQTEFKK
ncbi:MAG: indolepyruvate oxidoreductase subunit beta [Treponema sp.]|jgi:indolepyruvate ferredoxin oxidoreductase beta subunit|nr:indolepyruvate oxidoreductase subunit beta [Treponema sp.]